MKVFRLLTDAVMTLILQTTLDTSQTWSLVACKVKLAGLRLSVSSIPGSRFDRSLPQVRCARWQAKHARRAFFRRGREGSFALLFADWPLPLVPWTGDFSSVEARSSFSSAMMPDSSSVPGSGEGDPSSGSGDILTLPRLRKQHPRPEAQDAEHWPSDCGTHVACVPIRQVLNVSSIGHTRHTGIAAQAKQECLLAACDHACARVAKFTQCHDLSANQVHPTLGPDTPLTVLFCTSYLSLNYP